MRILVAGGASGGHIFPALAFIDCLHSRCPGCRTLLVVPQTKAQMDEVLKQYAVQRVGAVAAGRGFNRQMAAGLAQFLKLCVQSLGIVLRFKPDVVVGFGSISSIPLLFWGWLLRLRTVVHEQNVVPGQATKALSLFVDTVCLSFGRTAAYLPSARRKCVITGNPLRASLLPLERQEACAFFDLDPALPTVLVMGGSQGSVTINRRVPQALSGCAGRAAVQVIHLSGSPAETAQVEAVYRAADIRARVLPFLAGMQYAYCACDLVVSRAGATSIAELMFFAKPAVLIPYPFARQHQYHNARVLEERGCARIVADEEVPARLGSMLEELLGDPGLRGRMCAAYGEWRGRSSTTTFTEEVLHV